MGSAVRRQASACSGTAVAVPPPRATQTRTRRRRDRHRRNTRRRSRSPRRPPDRQPRLGNHPLLKPTAPRHPHRPTSCGHVRRPLPHRPDQARLRTDRRLRDHPRRVHPHRRPTLPRLLQQPGLPTRQGIAEEQPPLPTTPRTGDLMTATTTARGKYSREKGATAERHLVAWLRTHGWPGAERAVRTGYRTADRTSVDPGDVTGTPGLVWQVKNRVDFGAPAVFAA